MSKYPQSLRDRVSQLADSRNIFLGSTTMSEYEKVDFLWKLYEEETMDRYSLQQVDYVWESDMMKEENVPRKDTYVDTPRDIANKVSITKDTYLDKFGKLIEEMRGDLPEDMKNILTILPHILKLQAQKSSVYGRSYARHGDLSIFLNTERKWDRISNIMSKAMQEGAGYLYSDKSGTPTETFVDTIVDLASYSLLWLGYIKENHPEVYAKFVKDNRLSLD